MLRITMNLPDDMVTREIASHGTYSAPQSEIARQMKRKRKFLVSDLLEVYDPSMGFGSCASHWRTYSKADLALVVASCIGDWRGR